MATKPKITNIADDFGIIVGNYSSGQTSDDRTPTLKGKLTKSLKKKEYLAIYSGDDLLGEADTTKKQWEFTPTFKLNSNYEHSFRAVHVNKKGKEGNESNSYKLFIDSKEPTLDVVNNVKGEAKGDITFEFNFSEPVSFMEEDIKLKGGTGGNFSGSGTNYTYVVSPKENSKGKIVLTIPSQTFHDLAGNENTKKYSAKQAFNTVPVDITPPTYEIVSNVEGIVNDKVTFEFVFSEEIQDFTSKDIKVTGGSKGKFSGSGDSYSLAITPDKNSEGNIVIKTKAGMVSDLAGNKNKEGITVKQAYDTKAPTFEINKNKGDITNEKTKFEFKFSENVEGFSSKDIKVSGGIKGKFSGSGDRYSLVVIPNENSEGDIVIKTKAGMVTDMAGNINKKGSSVKQAYDTKAPTFEIAKNKGSITNEDVRFDFLFSEKIKDFNSNDIKISGGSGGKLSGSGKKYEIVVTPKKNAEGNITLKLKSEAFADLAGNLNEKSLQIKQAFDTKSPELRIEDYSEIITDEKVDFTFSFTENISGFKSSDISVTGGTKGNLTGSGDLYTLEVYPEKNSQGTIDIKVGKEAVSDAAGNSMSDKVQISQPYDTRITPRAKDFVAPFDPLFEDTVTSGLNFGDIYSELVREKDFPIKGYFTSDDFKIKSVSIDNGEKLSPAEAGITVNNKGKIQIDTTVDAYQDLNDGEVVDVVTKFIVTSKEGLSDNGTISFQVEGVDEAGSSDEYFGFAKDFVSPLPPQAEDTVEKDLNFGVIYSELVKTKYYPNYTFTSDNFKIQTVSIDSGEKLSPSEAGITINNDGFIKIDTRVDAYQYLIDGDEVDVVVKFKVTDNIGLSDIGTVTFKVTGASDGNEKPRLIAKDFLSPLPPQPEDTVEKDLNFGVIYSELVKTKYYPEDYTFNSDNFKIQTVSIDGGKDLSASEAGITVNNDGFIKIDTRVDAYQYLVDGDEIDVVTKFKVTDNNGLSDIGTVTFRVEGVSDGDEKPRLIAKDFISPLSPQPENTVVKNLNFGEIYSELVKTKYYPKDYMFTSDNFKIKGVSIDKGENVSASEAGITVNNDGFIKIDTRVEAYQYLKNNELVDVVATFKVTDDFDQSDFGTVTFQVLGFTD